VLKGGRWHLAEEWIEIDDRPARFAVPGRIAASVVAREGRRCTYCGSTEGPFDLDHIFPVARGGTNDASNLTLACASCNRSKGAKTLREWIGR
jgi:5-methylcytosine-specific restriction endonuclease McrA